MKKIFILLGCVASSYVSVVQAQKTPIIEAETFVVVPKNEISGKTLEPISIPLDNPKTTKAKSIEPDFEEKEVRVEAGDYRKDEVDMMELVRREHARNVAKDEAEERARQAEENKKSAVAKSNNSKKPTLVAKKEPVEKKVAIVDKNKQTTVKAKQENNSSKPGVKKVANTGVVVNKSGNKAVKLEKQSKATAKAEVNKVSALEKTQARVIKKESVKAKAVTSKTNAKVIEKRTTIDKNNAVKKPQEKSKK